ncbi:MATE family efflux transporter [Streptacidiphilus rugosus]|uniref:MATE family efflux transporter n=1 Tax=Streptacidiphilus rugosus TaxID=405783 RepID=UPI0005617E6B|nr:MATE family efflux transporter [Streptacidiphilus rugosus]
MTLSTPDTAEPARLTPPPVPIRAEIVSVAVPVAVGAVVWVGGQFVVGALLGHLPGDALYVRGLLIPVGFLFVALQEALEVVTQIGTARCRGRGELAALRGLFGRLCLAGWAAFAVVAVAVALAAPTLAALMHVPAGAAGDFVAVLRWTALVNVFGVPVNVATAMLRGGGRPRGAAALTFTVTVLQIAGVWLLGLRGGLGVFSLPWSAAASGACGLALGVGLLLRSGALRRAPAEPPPPAVAVAVEAERGGPPVAVRSLLVGIGLPIAATYVMLSLSNLVTEWILTPFGTATVAGYGAAISVQSVAVVPALALGTATAVTANRRWAGGEVTALPAALRTGLRIAVAGYLFIALLCLPAAGTLARLMTSDPETAARAATFLRIVGPSFLGLGVVLFLLTFLEQIGGGLLAASSNLCYFTLTLAVGGSLARAWGDPQALYGVWAAANVLGVAGVLPLTLHRVRRVTARAESP